MKNKYKIIISVYNKNIFFFVKSIFNSNLKNILAAITVISILKKYKRLINIYFMN